MIIPFPQTITGLDVAPKLKEYMLNMFLTQDGAIRTPGIERLGYGHAACRGCVTWRDGLVYMVSGDTLIRINSDGTTTDLGAIAGTADVDFSQGQVNLVIIVKGGNGYYYNESAGLNQIGDADFVPSVSVDFIDGRHVFIPADGEPAFYSDVDSPNNISPLSFFDAEELPDKNKAVINSQNQLYILGDDSAEIFRTNVDPDLVFTRRQNSRVDVGYISALVRYRTTFCFLGRKRGQAARFYAMSAGQAEPISTPAIDEIINKEYTQSEREACEAYRYEWKGYEILVFTLARHTFKFIDGQWIYANSEIANRLEPEGQWRVKGITYAGGRYIVGDRRSSQIGYLSDIGSEYGDDVEFEVQTFIRDQRDSYLNIKSIEIDGLTGQASSSEVISLRVSRDGRTYGEPVPRSLGTTGEYSKRILWRPIGVFENFCGIKLRSTAAVSFGLESVQFT